MSSYPAIHQQFRIPVEYSVQFTDDALDPINPLLANAILGDHADRCDLLVFIDDGLLLAHPALTEKLKSYVQHWSGIKLLQEPLPVPGGEACKNDPQRLDDVYRIVLEDRVDRHGCILAIGGGAVLDYIGYATATAHRGIRHIRMPTTVLSQNDSGIGVKNGINFLRRKNFLGTFAPPDAVICDFSMLQTLSPRDKRAGMAEAVKVSLIRDRTFFDWLENHAQQLAAFEMNSVRHLIMQCARLHARQISAGGDPFEKGSSRPLDYGHWLAHKLEDLSGFEVRHGEAVAIGMLVDARYAMQAGLLDESDVQRILRLLQNLGFRLWHSSLETTDGQGSPLVLQGIEEFREHLGGALSITLLNTIGTGVEVDEINPSQMISSLDWVRSIA